MQCRCQKRVLLGLFPAMVMVSSRDFGAAVFSSVLMGLPVERC